MISNKLDINAFCLSCSKMDWCYNYALNNRLTMTCEDVLEQLEKGEASKKEIIENFDRI